MSNLVTKEKTGVRAPTKSSPSRLNINLPPEMCSELKRQAEEEGVSVTEIVRRAISVERFFREHKKAGNEIFIHEKGQEVPSRVFILW